MTDLEILQAIAAVSQKVNDLAERIDTGLRCAHEDNAANIDYIAMMSDVELPEKEGGAINE